MYHKWQSYDVWFLRYWAQQTECFVILGYFLLFYSPKTLSTKNENHMMYDFGDMEHNRQNFYHFGLSFAHHKIYDSWDMKCNRQNIFVILGHFLPFYPPNSPKNENIKKLKKTPTDIIMIICYTVPEIWCVTNVIIIYHFGLFFALLPP